MAYRNTTVWSKSWGEEKVRELGAHKLQYVRGRRSPALLIFNYPESRSCYLFGGGGATASTCFWLERYGKEGLEHSIRSTCRRNWRRTCSIHCRRKCRSSCRRSCRMNCTKWLISREIIPIYWSLGCLKSDVEKYNCDKSSNRNNHVKIVVAPGLNMAGL